VLWGEDIPIKMVYDLTATFAQQMQAEGVVATNKVSKHSRKNTVWMKFRREYRERCGISIWWN
jgi:hypothetical protein